MDRVCPCSCHTSEKPVHGLNIPCPVCNPKMDRAKEAANRLIEIIRLHSGNLIDDDFKPRPQLSYLIAAALREYGANECNKGVKIAQDACKISVREACSAALIEAENIAKNCVKLGCKCADEIRRLRKGK